LKVELKVEVDGFMDFTLVDHHKTPPFVCVFFFPTTETVANLRIASETPFKEKPNFDQVGGALSFFCW